MLPVTEEELAILKPALQEEYDLKEIASVKVMHRDPVTGTLAFELPLEHD